MLRLHSQYISETYALAGALRCLRIRTVDNALCTELFRRKQSSIWTHTHCAAMQLWLCNKIPDFGVCYAEGNWTSPKTVKACTMRCLSVCQEAVVAPSEGVRVVWVSSASMMRRRCAARCLLSARVA